MKHKKEQYSGGIVRICELSCDLSVAVCGRAKLLIPLPMSTGLFGMREWFIGWNETVSRDGVIPPEKKLNEFNENELNEYKLNETNQLSPPQKAKIPASPACLPLHLSVF